ncbi:MAG: hypothetical protein IJL87_05835 [Clostridia bacterium]|nr:hypothetical protein [Clostridia bacterium]
MSDFFYYEDTLGLIFFIFAIALPVLFGLIFAIIKAVYAKNTGVKKWGLALLPVGTDYITGKLADMYNDRKYRIWLPILSGISFVISLITFGSLFASFAIDYDNPVYDIIFLIESISWSVSYGISIALFIMSIIAYYRIFAYKNRESAPVWTVLTVLLYAIPAYIFMLAFSKKQGTPKVSEPHAAAPDYKSETVE